MRRGPVPSSAPRPRRRPLRRALVALLLVAGAGAADGTEAQDRFREAYRDDAPLAQRRAAILELARADVPEAADLLFSTWERLEEETLGLRKDLHEVRRKARAMRIRVRSEPAKVDPEALRALETRETDLDARLGELELERAAILQGVASLKAGATLGWLAEHGLSRARSPALLRGSAERVMAWPEGGVAAVLDALEKTRDAGQAVALLDALASRGDKVGAPGLPTILKRLSDRDGAVRAAAAQATARAALPEGVAALVRQVQRESDRSRTQREMFDALRILTGANPGDDPKIWQKWWRDHEAEVMAGKTALGAGKPAPVTSDQGNFYGIPQLEDRIIYVLDRSGSMIMSMENPRFVNGGPVAARDDEDSRFDAATRELLRAAKSLRRDARYTVVAYSDHAEAILGDTLEPAKPERHAALAAALAQMGAEGQTNIYEALDLALRLAGVHPEEPPGPARADAIYLLTDGAPTDARGQTEDPERTLEAAREWNALRRVAIHTIGIGADHNSAFLRQLAAENGGTYWAVKPRKKEANAPGK
ncbi:MAG TPA: vWA domain-containing protein [Planctomycetota bacterium]|nr:vWA domain-containing protein [Planctomycetota bacterium]